MIMVKVHHGILSVSRNPVLDMDVVCIEVLKVNGKKKVSLIVVDKVFWKINYDFYSFFIREFLFFIIDFMLNWC